MFDQEDITMKNGRNRQLSVMLAFIIMLTIAPLVRSLPAAEAKTYKTGDIIAFGSYPQSRVTDSDTLSALDKISKNWVSYNYYSGSGNNYDGLMQPGDWMRYADIDYNGCKYRAVTFDSYRLPYTGVPTSTSETYNYSYTNQHASGYTPGNVYYFKYESLLWRVLDPNAGLVLSERIIDSQAYQNTIWLNSRNGRYYQGIDSSVYANDYASSSIRGWLNEDFYNTAFSKEERSLIGETDLDNSAYASSYNSASTKDRVFLLSYNEMLKTNYGFNSFWKKEDAGRCAQGTDYAKCQGLWISDKNEFSGNSSWWLRSPGDYSDGASYVFYSGCVYGHNSVYNCDKGIRPAFSFQSGIRESENPNDAEKTSGRLPGDVSGDGAVTAEDARFALRAAVGLESYAAGSPEFLAADATKDGAVTAEDARLILRAAVGLETLA